MLLELRAGELLAALGPRRALLALAEHPLPPQEQDAVDRVAEHGDLRQETLALGFRVEGFLSGLRLSLIVTVPLHQYSECTCDASSQPLNCQCKWDCKHCERAASSKLVRMAVILLIFCY